MGKKSKKGLIESINFGCYTGEVILIHDITQKQIIKCFKKCKLKYYVRAFKTEPKSTFDDAVEGYATAVKRTITIHGESQVLYFITIPAQTDLNDYEDILTIAHECIHICQYVLPGLMDRNTELEAEAYFHSHLMRQIIEAIKKYQDT